MSEASHTSANLYKTSTSSVFTEAWGDGMHLHAQCPWLLQVKLVKFLVNDLVIDVSFETLGGLCAVNFLQDMDIHIGRNSLFRRSIILVPTPPPPSHTYTQKCSLQTLSALLADCAMLRVLLPGF